ncbi:GNAT family N-acetyltransferase [Paenibacillus puldeungensis]|uniref:GNAT family N-acetyltransferase n=1 Tax=Paenibacillus puldeungensis TaxID=696536 RepID=A0ABW3S4D3_9BACL
MKEISIVKADARSVIGAKLNQIALGYMRYPLAGSKEERIVNRTFVRLWKWSGNRFSHQYAFEAKMGEQTLGIITCYPIPLLNRLAWPTFKILFSYRKLALIGYNLLNLKDLYSTLTLKEGHDDEYHIGTLAALPESRGLGVGSMLMKFAEEQASLQGYHKCSLTVKKENHRALKLYERLGYQITGEINKPAFSLFRMAKKLEK